MNLVTTHYNCTSPLDYISHHALHSHIPIHHHTNHTAVTNHSFALIASPHLHLIHTLTYKQHTYTHPLRSLVLPRLTFWAFPLFSDSLCLPGLPIYSDRLLPALLTLPACWYLLCLLPGPTFALPLLLILPSLHYSCYCLWPLPVWPLVWNKAAIGSNLTASSLQYYT